MGLIVSDTFTEVGTVDLTAHTPDTGTGWTEEERTGVSIQQVPANDVTASVTEASDRHLYTVQPNPSELDIALKINFTAIPNSADDPWFFVARLTDASNYYSAGVYIGVSANGKKIVKKVAGTVTELASGIGVSPAVNDRLEFLLEDGAKKLLHNRHEILSTADNALTAVGRCGFGAGNAWLVGDDINGGWDADDFTVHDGVQTRLAGTGLSEAPGAQAWDDPGFITADDESVALNELDNTASERLRSTQTGAVFSIPSGAAIDGIEVEAEEEDTEAAGDGNDIEAKLCKAGVPVGADRFSNPWPTVETMIVRGSATDKWGTTWTDAQINATGFGFALRAQPTTGALVMVAEVDFWRFRVHYTPGGTPVSNAVVDTHEALQGVRQTV